MASKRCLPTRFFKDADIMNVSKDAQLIRSAWYCWQMTKVANWHTPSCLAGRSTTRPNRSRQLCKSWWLMTWSCSTWEGSIATTV
jgi:hypothetical protein